MSEVCGDVAVELLLQALEGETFDRNSTATDDTRFDIKANGLAGTVFERIVFDVKIFNLLAKSCPKTIRDSYKYHQELKKLKYEQRMRDVENSTFNPLCFRQLEAQVLRRVKSWNYWPRKSPRKGKKNTPMWCHSSGRKQVLHYWRAPFYASEDAEPLNRQTPLKTQSPAFWPKAKSTKFQ